MKLQVWICICIWTCKFELFIYHNLPILFQWLRNICRSPYQHVQIMRWTCKFEFSALNSNARVLFGEMFPSIISSLKFPCRLISAVSYMFTQLHRLFRLVSMVVLIVRPECRYARWYHYISSEAKGFNY